jgi:predicted small lipoprotein YifL
MSRLRSAKRPSRRQLVLTLLAAAALAACGKKGTLRLPRPDETGQNQDQNQNQNQDDDQGLDEGGSG